MPRILYQVGDFPLFNHVVGVNGGDASLSDSRDWRVATSTLSEVAGEYISGSYYNPLAQPNKLSVKGSFDDSNGLTIDQKLNKLMFLAGRTNLPFIAFDYQACDCGVEGCGHTPKINWLIAYGVLLGVDRAVKWIDKQDTNPTDTLALNLDIKLEVAWRRLSPYIWEYRRGGAVVDPFDDACVLQGGGTAARFIHPSTLETLDVEGFFYRWGDDLIRYDPQFWGVKYTDGVTGGLGSDFFKLPYTVKVLPDPRVWNGPLTSLYAITRATNVGVVHIRVSYPTGLGANMLQSDDNYLDLSVVDSDLSSLGYGGLREDDVIIFGSVIPYPCFVLRDDEIIEDYIPRWTFNQQYPGQTFSGPNKLEFFAEGADARMAYLVEYGVY